MTDTTEVHRYDWLRHTPIGKAGGCITLLAGADPATAIHAFGASTPAPWAGTLADLPAGGDPPSVAVARLDDHDIVVAVEVNGWQGSRPEVLRRASRQHRTVSLFCNVNGDLRFSVAAHGRVLASFDPLFADRSTGTDPDAVQPHIAALPPLDPDATEYLDPLSWMAALAARITGYALTPALQSTTFAVSTVQPWTDEPHAGIDPELHNLTYQEPLLAWALRHADEPQLRAAATAAATHAVHGLHLHDRPAVADALHTPTAATGQGLDALARTALAHAKKPPARAALPPGSYFAVQALRELANTDPLAAAFNTITAARTALDTAHLSLDHLHDAVLATLGNPPAPTGSLGLTTPPTSDPLRRHHWIRAHWLAPAGNLTIVHHATPDQVATALAGRTADAAWTTPALSRHPSLALRQDGDHTIAVGTGTKLRPHDTDLLRLPATTAVSVLWAANGRIQLWYLTDGRIHTHLDPFNLDTTDGDDPHALDDHLAALHLPHPPQPGPARQLPALLALTEAVTTQPFTPERLDQPHWVMPITPNR